MKKIKNLKDGVVVYANHRKEPYFTFVKNGKKTIEGRLKKENYDLVKAGDQIIIWNERETESLKVRVKRVCAYKSFEQMLENEELKKVLPEVKTINEGLAVYRKFYTEEQERKFGVLAIEVERCNVW